MEASIMAGKVTIKRGDVWAERLKAHLTDYPEGAAEWMEENTRILNSTVDSLSGLLRVDGELAYLKLYRFSSLKSRLLYYLGRSQSVKNYRRAIALRQKGLALPDQLAYLTVSQGTLVVSEGFAEGGNLAELWLNRSGEEDFDTVMRSTGESLAALHAAGYVYGDCHWANLFWNGERVYLTDFNETRKCRVGGIPQSKDLARFTANAEELGIGLKLYEQFLGSYLDGVPGSRREIVESMIRPLYRIRGQHMTDGYGQRLI
jgi:tRNA A-37 threonylcarbamoyl transferase component Bud32